jgi:hypothetical protein
MRWTVEMKKGFLLLLGSPHLVQSTADAVIITAGGAGKSVGVKVEGHS